MKSPLRFVAPLVIAGLVLSLGACGTEQKEGESTEDATAAADAPAATEPGAPAVAGIEGLDTEKKQVSYMIGLDIANSLDPLKDELDVDLIAEAMRARFAGETPKLSEELVQIVQEAFTAKLQARQAAEAAEKASKTLEEGTAFLASNKDKPGVSVTESGLQYRVERAGNGATPKADDVVRVHYKGTLPNGDVFDSSYDRGQPAEFGLGQVIPGWSEGVQLMKVGSKYTFWIPSDLGYGETGGGGVIPPHTMLTFEVELLEIVE